ncbi:unnamed protein product [Anisakis simplex]|uniref:Lipase_3 domain-containing protein n=1 Tax=Anisakis simplex TaxID=6269 RepID=A0A0M3J1A9_ANISI|nr:unnamed protein product [Anisakis simplex]
MRAFCRGTHGFLQTIDECITTIFESKIELPGAGEVNKYFFEAFKSVWDGGISEDFLSLKKQHPSYELWVTGYSLGGSMASIASTYIVSSGLFKASKVKLITFGEPRTGDHEFATVHGQLLYYTYRVVHQNDLVPHVPIKNYRGYYHHLYEVTLLTSSIADIIQVWYNNSMEIGDEFVVCSTAETESCSDSVKRKVSLKHHLMYFGERVTEFCL